MHYVSLDPCGLCICNHDLVQRHDNEQICAASGQGRDTTTPHSQQLEEDFLNLVLISSGVVASLATNRKAYHGS